MSDQAENETIEIEAEAIPEAPVSEMPAEEEGELVVSIGEEAPPPEDETQSAPGWVKDLRRQYREEKRRVRELERRLSQQTAQAPAQAQVTMPKKPTLADVDYDTERFEREVDAWHEKKRAYEAQIAAKNAEEQSYQQAWQAKLNAYETAKTSLKARDYDEAEEIVKETLSVTQQGMILAGAENPALLVYALGRNPNKARELAALSDPVQFAFAVARLETQLKIQTRKPSVKPEATISGNAPKSGAIDNTLDRLRAEADRTGDYSKVMAYKRSLKKRA
jgi:hypothetical protein